jgi:DNA-binding NtrC family response regulator
MKLAVKVKRWLDDARPRAMTMVVLGVSYRDAIAQLMFFYTRSLIAIHGQRDKATAVMQVQRDVVCKYSKPPKNDLTAAALAAADSWASELANAGATFREAFFVFKRVLMESAIERAEGNRAEAARMLKVHRNTMWGSIPRSPREIWPLKKVSK